MKNLTNFIYSNINESTDKAGELLEDFIKKELCKTPTSYREGDLKDLDHSQIIEIDKSDLSDSIANIPINTSSVRKFFMNLSRDMQRLGYKEAFIYNNRGSSASSRDLRIKFKSEIIVTIQKPDIHYAYQTEAVKFFLYYNEGKELEGIRIEFGNDLNMNF